MWKVCLLIILGQILSSSCICDIPPYLHNTFKQIRGCTERYGKSDACAVPCILDVLGWRDSSGLPTPKIAGELVKQLPNGSFKSAVESVVKCMADKASQVKPKKEDSDCLTYGPMGLCMRRAFKEKCPEAVI